MRICLECNRSIKIKNSRHGKYLLRVEWLCDTTIMYLFYCFSVLIIDSVAILKSNYRGEQGAIDNIYDFQSLQHWLWALLFCIICIVYIENNRALSSEQEVLMARKILNERRECHAIRCTI